MSNMSYCRFENTLGDLRDCYQAMQDGATNQDGVAERIEQLRKKMDALEAEGRMDSDEYSEAEDESERLDDQQLNEYEARALPALIALCKTIAEEFGEAE